MIRISALLVLALAGVVSGGLVGGNRCTWGPSYWCQSFQHADECSATEHCHNRVWSKLTKPSVVDGSDACTFCKDMVSDVKNILTSNQTEGTVLQYMNRACDFLPDQYSMQECKKIEQHYVDQFEKCVQDNIDPDAICKLCQLCNDGDTTQRNPQKLASKPLIPARVSHVSLKSAALSLHQTNDDAPLCDACESFIDLAKKEISNPSVQSAITSKLKADCEKMSATEALECEAAVSLAMPSVFKFVNEELTDKLCVSAGLCTSSSMTAAVATSEIRRQVMAAIHSDPVREAILGAAKSSVRDNNVCNTCEMIAGYAKIFLSNNATEQEIQQLLSTDVCPNLGEFSDMCKTLVEEYVPQLYAALLRYVDPATICKDLRLCSSVSRPRSQAVAAAPPAAVKKTKVRSSVQCVICEFAMSELESIISKNSTEEEVVAAVEKVCSLLPSSISEECDSLVEKYGLAIIKLIVSDVAPGTVCKFLGLCSSLDSRYKLSLPSQGDQLCSLCETTVSYAVSLLEENSTKQQIIDTVEKVCNFLSGEMASQCNSLVEQYGPALIELLVKNMKPKDVCSELRLCQSVTRGKVDGLVHLYKYKPTDNY